MRALTVTVINLVPADQPIQMDMFGTAERNIRQRKLDDCIYEIRRRFGRRVIIPAALLGDPHMPDDGQHAVRMPGMMYTFLK